MSPTTTPRRINADVFRRARKAGAPLDLAAYVARPPVLDLDWGYDDRGDVATFELDGRTFRASMEEPRDGCESCAELLQAWRDRDEGIAWMTEDEYDRTEHRVLTVELLDSDGVETGYDASLYGTCSLRSTEIDRLSDERFVAETVADLASEAAGYAETAERKTAERTEEARNARDAERERRLDDLTGLADRWARGHLTDTHLRDEMRAVLGKTYGAEPHTLTFHSTIRGEEGPVTMTVRRDADDDDPGFPAQTFPV